jgi:hypothetical protein
MSATECLQTRRQLFNDMILADALLQAAANEEGEDLRMQRTPSISDVVVGLSACLSALTTSL